MYSLCTAAPSPKKTFFKGRGQLYTHVKNWLVLLLLRYMIGLKTRATLSSKNYNQSGLVRTRFPALPVSYMSYCEFWLVHCIVSVLCDWLEWLLCFWPYDTQLKPALSCCLLVFVVTGNVLKRTALPSSLARIHLWWGPRPTTKCCEHKCISCHVSCVILIYLLSTFAAIFMQSP